VSVRCSGPQWSVFERVGDPTELAVGVPNLVAELSDLADEFFVADT